MTQQCGLCANYTLHFPKKEDRYDWNYFRRSKLGHCKLEPAAMIRAPSSGASCQKYEPANDMERRQEWMKGREKQ